MTVVEERYCRQVDFHASFPAERRGFLAVRGEAEAIARACGLDEPSTAAVGLAVWEAATNQALHGGREGALVHLTADAGAGELNVTVTTDEGDVPSHNGFNGDGNGYGMAMLVALASRVQVVHNGHGTEVRVT